MAQKIFPYSIGKLGNTSQHGTNAPHPNKIKLYSGYFSADGQYFLRWQGSKPNISSQKTAFHSKTKIRPCKDSHTRGTVLLLNDWGVPFAEHKSLLANLHSRGFCIVGYDRLGQEYYKQPQKKSVAGLKATRRQRIYNCGFDGKQFAAFIQKIVLPAYPPPFYILAHGLGALFALNGYNVLQNHIRSMILVSPVLSINNRRPSSIYHFIIKALSVWTPHYRKTKPAAQNSFAYQANVPDISAKLLSADYQPAISIPCLIITTEHDKTADIAQAHLLAEKLHMADIVAISSVSHNASAKIHFGQNLQFWAAYDAFVSSK